MEDGTVYEILVEDAQYNTYYRAMVSDGNLCYFINAGTNNKIFEKDSNGFTKVENVRSVLNGQLDEVYDYTAKTGAVGMPVAATRKNNSRPVFWVKIKGNDENLVKFGQTKTGDVLTAIYISGSNFGSRTGGPPDNYGKR
jgi:hypothetical protein